MSRSFMNLESITFHRRTEMEGRIKDFLEICDEAIYYIKKLKLRAQGFVHQLECDPEELKDHFLECMKQLDEYKYVMTEFNISVTNFEGIFSSENSPVHGSNMLIPVKVFNNNIIDILTDPIPSTSRVCANNCPSEKIKKTRRNKDEELLIIFSNSTSSNSIQDPENALEKNTLENVATNLTTRETPSKTKTFVTEIDVHQGSVTEDDAPLGTITEDGAPLGTITGDGAPIGTITKDRVSQSSVIEDGVPQRSLTEDNNCASDSNESKNSLLNVNPAKVEHHLPAQTLLQTNWTCNAVIVHVEAGCFYVITESIDDITCLMSGMTKLYKGYRMRALKEDELSHLTYCAYYDEETDTYYRALIIEVIMNTVKIFLVDTGEVRETPLSCIFLLLPQFCKQPPYARCCHLAGIESTMHTHKSVSRNHEKFMKQYIGTRCVIEVDDNTSESLGVFVILPTNETLNDLIVANGIDEPVETEQSCELQEVAQAVEIATQVQEVPFDICNDTETEDPLIAVSGYHNRDEADICKYYKGGPEKSCFKGSHCKKRHVLMHPDGWTLDRVEVLARCKNLPLPARGQYIQVRATYVCHYNRMYVHFVGEKQEEEIPNFGEVLCLKTLEGLVRDMNSPAQRIAYKPLALEPAPGEIVAALYPMDDQWYRARVVSSSRADQTIEVQYLDYGNVMWVRAENIRELPARHSSLPAQAVRVRLAEVVPKKNTTHGWLEVQRVLTEMVLDKRLEAHVLAHEYDELVVHIYDDEGYSVAEQLAIHELIEVGDFTTPPTEDIKGKVVLPA